MTNTRETRFDTSEAVAAAFGRPLIAYGLPVGAALAIGELATRLAPPVVATLVTVVLLVVAHAVGAAAVARLVATASASVPASWAFAGERLPRALLGTVYPAAFVMIATLLVTAVGVLLPGMPAFIALALALLVAVIVVPTLRTLPLLVLTERRGAAAIRDSWGPTEVSRTAPVLVMIATVAALILASLALAPVAVPIVAGVVMSIVATVGATVLVTVASVQALQRVQELDDTESLVAA